MRMPSFDESLRVPYILIQVSTMRMASLSAMLATFEAVHTGELHCNQYT